MAEKEYIEREAFYDFCKDQIEEETGAYSKGRNAGLRVAMSAAMNKDAIPTADVRPAVLCKDCKWTETDGMEDPAIYCEKWDRWEMPPDGFCWLGKKREES